MAAKNFKDKPRLQTDFDKLEKKVENQRDKLNEDISTVLRKQKVYTQNNNTDQEGQIVITDHKFSDYLWGNSAC